MSMRGQGLLSLPRVGHAVDTKQLLAAPRAVEPHKFLVGVWTFAIALVAVRLSGNQSHEQDLLFYLFHELCL